MNSPALWQVQVDDQIYQAELNEIIEWIDEGAVLPKHKIRRGNLRWLPAVKVPELQQHFDKSVSLTQTSGEFSNVGVPTALNFSNMVPAGEVLDLAPPDAPAGVERIALETFCSVHRDRPSEFVCGTCGLAYCKECPNRFGSDVRICPSCGAMCITYADARD